MKETAALTILIVAGLGLLLFGCLDSLKSKPLPADKVALAGCWVSQDDTVFLMVSSSGEGKYKAPLESIAAPVSFNGSNMSIGAMGFSRVFSIERMPFDKNGTKAFVANGFEFTKMSCASFPSMGDTDDE